MNTKRFFTLALAVLMLLSLAACSGEPGTPPTTEPTPVEYKITLINDKNEPFTSGMIVKFLLDGQEVAMTMVNNDGVAAKTLDSGTYTLEFAATDGTAWEYDAALAVVSPEIRELTVCLTRAPERLFQSGENDPGVTAYYVEAGENDVELEAGKRNYFLFVPHEAGSYTISASGDIEAFGYYGSPFYMTDNPIFPVENNSFSTSIRADMISHGTGTDVMLLGVDAGTATKCTISIQRTGDPVWTPDDVPYTVYEPTGKLVPYTLPEGASLLEFDLTAATEKYRMVKDDDGFYHLNDTNGPLVLVKLGVNNKYTPGFKTMMSNTGIRAYFYDENGDFLRREDYSKCLESYAGREKNRVNPVATSGVMDEEHGVYPLNDDLAYIIQNHGRHAGWFDPEDSRCIFRDSEGNPVPGINPEIAWLFMCCYIAQ